MAAELDEQCTAKGIEPTRIWLSASGATLGGLALGRRVLSWGAEITGIEPIAWPHATTPEIAARTGNEAAELLGLPFELAPGEVDSRAGFIGPGYQMPSPEGLAAMVRVARTDALLLDPSYTGKAMAALMAAVAAGELTEHDTVIFVHTGGLPAVFAHADVIREAVGAPGSSVDSSPAEHGAE